MRRPDDLDEVLARGDFVIDMVPETLKTQKMFGSDQFRLMKNSDFFINIGRGTTMVLHDLVTALDDAGEKGGAGLDVFETEPLPDTHPRWTAQNVLITPHVAGIGPYLGDRRSELFLYNCLRFNQSRPLRNILDKAHWY